MTFSHDMTKAPRGRAITVTRKVKTADGMTDRAIEEFVPDILWLATKCGKVVRSYWIPEAGRNPARWSGFATGEQPIAWQRFVVPDHPGFESEAA